MRKIILILLISFSSSFLYSQCNYTLTLNDSYGDGWNPNWLWGSSYIQIDTNGTNIYNWTLSDGFTWSNIITVEDGATLDLYYWSNGNWESENSWTLTDCNGNTVWSGVGGSNQSTSITTNCTPCTPLVAADGDCGVAPTVCSDAAITANSTGLGNHNDLNLTNQGCLASGENYSNWIYFHADVAGTIEFTITPSGNDDFDFAVWSSSTCPPTSLPIRCSWAWNDVNTGSWLTGLQTGAGDLSEGSTGDGWVESIVANAGDEFVLLIDNYSTTTNNFTLTWTLSGGVTLDCTLLPVDYISFTYDCETQKLNWQTLSETNNDYFIIEIGESFDSNAKLIIDNTYSVTGNGNTNFISNYSFPVSINNKYIRLSQIDYDGTINILETKYINCDNSFDNRSVKLHPNPSAEGNIVTIDGEYSSVVIYNSIGQKINTEVHNNQIIGLSKGFYFVQFDNNNPIKLIIR